MGYGCQHGGESILFGIRHTMFSATTGRALRAYTQVLPPRYVSDAAHPAPNRRSLGTTVGPSSFLPRRHQALGDDDRLLKLPGKAAMAFTVEATSYASIHIDELRRFSGKVSLLNRDLPLVYR